MASPHSLSTMQPLLGSELQTQQQGPPPTHLPSLNGHLCKPWFPKLESWGPLSLPHIQPILSAINSNDDNNDKGYNDSWHLWVSHMQGTPNTLLPQIIFPV